MTLITLTALEVAARVWLVRLASDRSFVRYASLAQVHERLGTATGARLRYEPHRYIGYTPRPGFRREQNRHNALGYRGDEIDRLKPPGEFRIACIGGSTTYTTQINDYRLSYPHLLQEELHEAGFSHVRVINSGAGGWSSWESLVNLQFRLLDLDPDLIIVYHGFNDVSPRLVWPPEAYVGDNSGRRGPAIGDRFMPSILEYSTLYRIFAIRLGLMQPHSSLSVTYDNSPATFAGSELDRQRAAGTYPEGLFIDVPVERMLAANRPIYFRRNLENMVAVAELHGVDVLLTTFAWADERVARGGETPERAATLEEMNSVVLEVAEAADVDLFDFRTEFPQDTSLFTDAIHVNPEGAAVKAELFSAFLIENGLLSPSGAADPADSAAQDR